MACGEAKFTGEVGVCLATSGPGAVHLLNGLYDAKLDHQPVLALVGQQARSAIGSHYQQDLDLQSLFKDVAGAFVQTASTPSSGSPSDRPCLSDREGATTRYLRDLAERSPGGDDAGADSRARNDSFGDRN